MIPSAGTCRRARYSTSIAVAAAGRLFDLPLLLRQRPKYISKAQLIKSSGHYIHHSLV